MKPWLASFLRRLADRLSPPDYTGLLLALQRLADEPQEVPPQPPPVPTCCGCSPTFAFDDQLPWLCGRHLPTYVCRAWGHS